MSKIKVSTLEGQSLNDQVAKALGWEIRLWGDTPVWFQADGEKRFRCMVKDWKPSTDWAQGGPIIQSERICITGPGPMGGPDNSLLWTAHIDTGSFAGSKYHRGPTALITAMRAFVGGHFGEEVDG